MRFHATTALAAILALPGIALAQTAGTQDQAEGQVDVDVQGIQGDDAGAAAQAGQGAGATGTRTIQAGEVISLNEWAYNEVYANGWSAENFIDEMEVYGQTGDEIGDVEDLIVDPQGRLVSLVAEVGGFWDIGDTHVSVPWQQVEVRQAWDGVTVPVTEENVEQYEAYAFPTLRGSDLGEQVTAGLDDADRLGPRAFRLSELIGDYARIRGQDGQMAQQTGGAAGQQAGAGQQGGAGQQAGTMGQQPGAVDEQVGQMDEQVGQMDEQVGQMGEQAGQMGVQPGVAAAPGMRGTGMGMMNYGYVSDVIISDQQIAAVVVEPRGVYGPGYYAYPYYGYGYGWTPGAEYYDLPYNREQIGEARPFEYGELEYGVEE